MYKIGNGSATSTNSPPPTIGTPKKRPPLALLKRGVSVVPSPEIHSASSSRESAFTFHQNLRSSFLFGKNNVLACAGGDKKTPGYLSLHQDLNRLLLLKWIPNSLLLSKSDSTTSMQSSHPNCAPVSIRFETITHLHLHRRAGSLSSMVVLIDADGVQQFAFLFALEQHCLSFLKSLENGLSPCFKLDPPLHSVKFGDMFVPKSAAAVPCGKSDLRKLRSTDSDKNMLDKSGQELVFRIISFVSPSFDQKATGPSPIFSRSSTQDSKGDEQRTSLRETLSDAKKAMQNQILSRAFFGWLSYCRHLRTIRLNLATIVTIDVNMLDSDGAELPVNEAFWKICRSEKTIALYKQFLTRVYFCGIDPEIRSQVWPYLLRFVEWHEDLGTEKMTEIERNYRRDLAEWTEMEREFSEGREKVSNASIPEGNNDVSAPKNCSKTCHSNTIDGDLFEESTDFKTGENSLENPFAKELSTNVLRIQKDVDRCDRTTKFYSQKSNLEILQRVICTYIYRRLKRDLADGYVQGMCDLIAPLLVVFGNEALTLACFEKLMRRMRRNFPQSTHNNGMEENLNNFRSLVEVMDPELYCQMMRNIDYSFVVFYRWLLLDFKRELVYKEVFQLWEVIWAAEMSFSRHFELFFGLALLTQYREVLIENEMDFTDVIKFFNEMAEKHNLDELMDIARTKMRTFQAIIHDLNRKS